MNVTTPVASKTPDWVNVLQQLLIDAVNLAQKWRKLVLDIVDARTPENIINAHVSGNFDEVQSHTTLAWDKICIWLKTHEWWVLKYLCSFFERTNELIVMWSSIDEITRRESYLYQIVIIHKLLTEWFNGYVPPEILMKDIFQPSQLKKLSDLWIVAEIQSNAYWDERQVRLYRKKSSS